MVGIWMVGMEMEGICFAGMVTLLSAAAAVVAAAAGAEGLAAGAVVAAAAAASLEMSTETAGKISRSQVGEQNSACVRRSDAEKSIGAGVSMRVRHEGVLRQVNSNQCCYESFAYNKK
jgi:hypothetical protein